MENWHKIEELLNAALELEPRQRSAFLDVACANAIELRREVESLLAAECEAENFLASPAVAFSADFFEEENDAAETLIGQQIGNYKIVRELGRGGMGAVYLAERADGKFEQKVAIKLLKRELNTADIRRRFRHERQILAALEHPNIARLVDAGTTADGLPFLVMEYVEGLPIDEFCDSKNLDLSARLKLFRTICAAVSFAHRNLIVHRDLKPSNILVTKEGMPKLLDFGISKLLTPEFEAESRHTVTRLGVMTPEYASPEQLRGENVTTTTDVFSLGVILYELLTNHRPFESKKHSTGEIIKAVCETEPERPSSVVSRQASSFNTTARANSPQTSGIGQRTKMLRGDLDNIILRALRKQPERRYSSVEQFSEDIRRHLANLPIMARPDTLSYRATKFVNRNKVAVFAVLLIILSLLGGIAATFWQAQRAAANQARAEKRFNDVRELSNALLFNIAPKIERMQGATEAREALVNQSLKYLDSLNSESADDFALQAELATAYEKVGDIQGNPTNPSRFALKEALESYEKANEIRRKLLEKSPRDFEQRRLLANNYRVQGDIRWQSKEMAEAQRAVETALNLYSELLAENPESLELRLAIGQIYLDIGQNYSDNEKFPEAIVYFQKAIGAAEELRRKYPDKQEVLQLLANGYQQIGSALSWNEQQKEGEAAMAQAIEIYEPLVAAHPNDVALRAGLWQTYWMTSSVYEEQNDLLANEYDFKALKIVGETVEKDPANLRAKEQLAKTYSHLGVTFANIGKPDESIYYLDKAVQMLQEISNNESKNRRFRENLATALIGLGDARLKQKDFQKAQANLEHAVAVLSELVGSDDTDNGSQRVLAVASESLAKSYEGLAVQTNGIAKQSYLEQAKQNYERELNIYRQLEARNALSNYDRKALGKLQASLSRYETHH